MATSSTASDMANYIWGAFSRKMPHVSIIESMPRWRPPAVGWIKLNVNGAAARDESWFAAGGLFRDVSGSWVVGFQIFIGRGTAFNSELCATLYGLEIARVRGFTKLVVESDSLAGI